MQIICGAIGAYASSLDALIVTSVQDESMRLETLMIAIRSDAH